MKGATAIRGGRRKRFFALTNSGKAALAEAQNIREKLMQALQGVSFNIGPA